jgi:hypothetical protein
VRALLVTIAFYIRHFICSNLLREDRLQFIHFLPTCSRRSHARRSCFTKLTCISRVHASDAHYILSTCTNSSECHKIALKAPLISSCNNDAVPPLFRAFITASTTIFTARSVDLYYLFPIWPSGRNFLSSATLVIRRANAASTIFPTVFNNEIGRQAPGVDFWAAVLLGFGSTVILAFLKRLGKYAAWKLLEANAANALNKGFPQAFRSPIGKPSSSDAFHGLLLRMMSSISSIVTR